MWRAIVRHLPGNAEFMQGSGKLVGCLPLDLAFADRTGVILCSMALMLAFDKHKGEIDKIVNSTCIRGSLVS